MLSEPLLVVARLGAFDDLGIRYLVGGSLASTIYGKPRATQDVNLVAEIAPDQAEPFAGALADEFYSPNVRSRWAVRGMSRWERFSTTDFTDHTDGNPGDSRLGSVEFVRSAVRRPS